MSQEERDELDWLKRAREGSITQREAARKLGVSDRCVRTLLTRMSKQGDAVVVHGLRGRHPPAQGLFAHLDLVPLGQLFGRDDRSRNVEEQIARARPGSLFPWRFSRPWGF
jgi:hypothetical protein